MKSIPSYLHKAILAGLVFSFLAMSLYDYFQHANIKTHIQRELTLIQEELKELPKESLNSMPWTLGMRTTPVVDPHREVEITLEFRQSELIDSIIILPSTYTVDSHELMSFGFPKRFSIYNIGPSGNQLLVDYREKEYPNPGIEPQIFNLDQAIQSSGIVFKTHELRKDATWWAENYDLSLSEIFVFSGEKNVALHAKPTLEDDRAFSYVWNRFCLVDGFSLFSPVIRKSIHPLKYTFMPRTSSCNLIFENSDQQSLDEVRLWPVIHSLQHNYPPSSGLGFPQDITIHSSNTPDFKESTLLYKSPKVMPKPGSNPFCIPIPETIDRYIKLDLNQPLIDHRKNIHIISLAEIELLSRGLSIASGNWQRFPEGNYPNLQYLNDGYSNEGKILPLKTSLLGLSMRAELEKKVTQLSEQLVFLEGEENEKVRNLLIIVLCTIVMLGLVIIILRYQAQKKWQQLRENIAADLHDEVGANLSSIKQYNELLKHSTKEALSDKQLQLFDRAIETTWETSQQTRQLIHYLERKAPIQAMNQELYKICQNILHMQVSYDPERFTAINKLKQDHHWHFMMFFKEALNNIRKHASANKVHIELKTQSPNLILQIKDDGKGFDAKSITPLHLASRVEKMKAKLNITSSPQSGTDLQLTLSPKHFS